MTTTPSASSVGGEVRTTSSTGAEKGVKPERHDLIPVPALTLLARLYGKGAEKYAAHNWRKVTNGRNHMPQHKGICSSSGMVKISMRKWASLTSRVQHST